MFQRKRKCEVCGHRFAPTKEAIYTVEEPRTVLEALTTAPTRFSAMDCPRCGCQIALAVRQPRVDIPQIIERETDAEVAEDED